MLDLGKLLVGLGVSLVFLGLLLWTGLGNWIGKLPGDIRITRPGSGFYFPVVTCLILSIVLSVIVSSFRR